MAQSEFDKILEDIKQAETNLDGLFKKVDVMVAAQPELIENHYRDLFALVTKFPGQVKSAQEIVKYAVRLSPELGRLVSKKV